MKRLWLILALAFAGCIDIRDGGVPPSPVPVVKYDSLFIITIDDALSRTPQTSALLRDKTYWDSVIAKGNQFRELDTDDPAAKKYDAAVTAAGGPPAVVLIDMKTNKLAAAQKLPADQAGMDKLIKQLTGK